MSVQFLKTHIFDMNTRQNYSFKELDLHHSNRSKSRFFNLQQNLSFAPAKLDLAYGQKNPHILLRL